MAEIEEKLRLKLELLEFTSGKTRRIIEGGNLERIKGQESALIEIINAVARIQIDVEENKLLNGTSVEEIKNWTSTIEAKMDKFDLDVVELRKQIADADSRAEEEKTARQEFLAARQREEQLNYEHEQLKLRAQFNQGAVSEENKHGNMKASVKLPKLVITKFDGKLDNWLGFWNKFEAEIDASNIPIVTKFAYLKELVQLEVRKSIDGLPFTTEGYERAKNILKSRYGKTSEIINTYVENIMALPTIVGANPVKIHQFYQTLTFNVQSLETLGKTTECWSMVRGTLDKLSGIKADLVRGKADWQTWGFPQLLNALREWTEINPCVNKGNEKRESFFKQKSFQAQDIPLRGCVYCKVETHKSGDCEKFKTSSERRRFLRDNRLCFNCTGSSHRADQCRSRRTCMICKQRHHTSICDKDRAIAEATPAMTASGIGENVCHPVVIVKVNGVKCRALLDTGSTSTYVSSFLINLLQVEPTKNVTRSINTITGLVTKRIEIYDLNISDTSGSCIIPATATMIDRREILTVNNPNYPDIIRKYPYLEGVHMEETDTKQKLPIHVILGVNEYTKIKMSGFQRAGEMGEPVAEKTRFGWTIMTMGAEAELGSMFMCQTATTDYEELCRLDVLGLQDNQTGDQAIVHEEFIEQLERSPEGWYQTGLPWKGGHPPLPNNIAGSKKRLESLVAKLRRNGQLEDYDAIIQDQLQQGIVEMVTRPAEGREFYIPHKAVIKERALSTKLRIVYDASAKATPTSPSLNDCLDIGPPLQNQLWRVLVHGRFHAICIAGDIKQAFLQVRVKAADRDALRFHWIDINNPEHVKEFRFTRALFGLGPSPFLLAGVISYHLNSCRNKFVNCVNEIEHGLYVDDILLGGHTVEAAHEMRDTAIEIFRGAKFELHKWNSNVEELELNQQDGDVAVSYAKEQLGLRAEECGLLGLKWNKVDDTLGVRIPKGHAHPTKRGVLGKIAKIYDPLGLVAPITLQGKILYREICQQKIGWDATLPKELLVKLTKWEEGLPELVESPRALVNVGEEIQSVTLHSFGDASGQGVAAAVYAVVEHEISVTQGLVAARSRLAKQGLTIPRLELIAGHMAVNLITNVADALSGFPVESKYCWLDSTVALHWILGGGEYKQFVANRVHKIREHDGVIWRHVPTMQNPADLASRGGKVGPGKILWWKGPDWLNNPEDWPPEQVTLASKESNAEAKCVQQVFTMATVEKDQLDELMDKVTYWRTLRVCAWVQRFVFNMRCQEANRRKGPLTTTELEAQRIFWIKREQSQCAGLGKFEEDRLRLNLHADSEGVLVCHGRIHGDFPVYIPDTSIYAEKLTEEAHQATIHGGVGLTMAKVREVYWIPRLRRLVKRVIKRCAGCKRFQAVAFDSPPIAPLPTDRTEGTTPFEVIGVDYSGPVEYRLSRKKQGKAYILLYSCSLIRAIHLELLPTLETKDFIRSFKNFIARRGRPKKVYSDNGRTFVGAARWLKLVQQDESMNSFLARNSINWQFNLSRAPWWGGQFERLIGLVKASLQKSIGKGMLYWSELSEVLLDVEVALNGRPLSYVEEDHQLPTLTPNALLYSQSNVIPVLQLHQIENKDLRGRAKYLQRYKQVLWSRWTSEYLRSLRERHNLKHKGRPILLQRGDVVIIRGDSKNRNQWKLGVVEELIAGRDGVLRAAKVRVGTSVLERAVQQLYPLELSCDHEDKPAPLTLNPGAPSFKPKRDAAVAARLRIQDDAEVQH